MPDTSTQTPGQVALIDAWGETIQAAREAARETDEAFKALRLQAIASLEEAEVDRQAIARCVGVSPGAISYLVGRKKGRPPGAPRGRGAKKVAE